MRVVEHYERQLNIFRYIIKGTMDITSARFTSRLLCLNRYLTLTTLKYFCINYNMETKNCPTSFIAGLDVRRQILTLKGLAKCCKAHCVHYTVDQIDFAVITYLT